MGKLTYLLFLLSLLFITIIFNHKDIESFEVQFGTPSDTDEADQENMKGLLEIGSQANEDTSFDTVSTDMLGDISKPTPMPMPTPPPDPVCFAEEEGSVLTEPYGSTNLLSYSPVCCKNKELDGLKRANTRTKFKVYEEGQYLLDDDSFYGEDYLNDYEDYGGDY